MTARGFWVAVFLLGLIHPALGGDPDPAKIDVFLKQLNKACDNPAAIASLYDWSGASSSEIDQEIGFWKMQVDSLKKGGRTAQPSQFLPLDTKEVDQASLADLQQKGQTRNGHIYKPNLALIGFAKVVFSDGKSVNGGMTLPLGVEPNGNIRIACTVAQDNTKPAPPDNAKFASFVQRIDALCAAKDLEGLKYLYEWTGASPSKVNEEIFLWEYDFGHGSYEKTTFIPLSDATDPARYNQDAIEPVIEGRTDNGHHYKPNLSVLGFVSITFQQATAADGRTKIAGSASRLYPVGLAPDGTIRFVVSVPAS